MEISIKPNQGITHALLEHVRNNGYDGPVTGEQWGATMDKLAEIQQRRGGFSAFRGWACEE